MKLVTIVGARPQFIKAAAVSRLLRHVATEVLVHTGQHYDRQMSALFFEELEIPVPDHNLGIGSGPHGWQTGRMLSEIEKVIMAEQPDWVLVYGDTNSTLAGALAAVKLHIPLAHVEAGLRSYNRRMPEEHNRVLTDHASDLLLCPTPAAVCNLAREGIQKGVHMVGDVMVDTALYYAGRAAGHPSILDRFGLEPREYALATVHRPRNTDDLGRLKHIMDALSELDLLVIFPVHPRARQRLVDAGLWSALVQGSRPRLIEPVGYLDMLVLEKNAGLILTDSGGVQKEAYFFGVPCLTLREETEWVETVDAGWNLLVGADRDAITRAAREFRPKGVPPQAYGDGRAADRIVDLLTAYAS